MRWKLLRRRFSISAPRMTVRSHLPWPLRWIALALVLGFSAALGLWAFEFGKDIAGLDRGAKAELAQLRAEVAELRAEREGATSISNTAESLIRAEKAAQDKLAQQLKRAEAENMGLKADLGFFERLLPASGSAGLSVRALQARPQAPGQLKFQALVMQLGRTLPEFNGRYEVLLTGTLAGKPWQQGLPGGGKSLQVKQSLRLDGVIDYPAQVELKTLQLKVIDGQGQVRASQLFRL